MVFINYCVFSLKCCDFSELCQFCCRAGVLPAWCVYTHWHQGKTEKGQSPEYFKIFGKKTRYLMTTLCLVLKNELRDTALSKRPGWPNCSQPTLLQQQLAGHQADQLPLHRPAHRMRDVTKSFVHKTFTYFGSRDFRNTHARKSCLWNLPEIVSF